MQAAGKVYLGVRHFVALLLLVVCSLAAEPAKVDTSTPVGQAFARMYNFDFPGAHAILDDQIQLDPQRPLPYVVKATAFMFAELHRLKILEIEFFEDDDKVVTRKKLKPDLKLREEFFRLIETARQRANARLYAQADDREATFTLCIAAGLVTDYAALIERRRFGSLVLARQTQVYVRQLVALQPPVYDAYLATGSTEYVVGSLPFYLRWFVRIDNIEGSKQKGMDTLQLVAERGRYYGPFARIVLAAINMREKRFVEAERLLADVSAEYPENPLLRQELQRASELRRRASIPRSASSALR
jgi:hypothetical protein